MLEADEMFAQTKIATVSMPRDRYDQPESEFLPGRDHWRPSRTDRIVRSVFWDVVIERSCRGRPYVGLKTATSETKNILSAIFSNEVFWRRAP